MHYQINHVIFVSFVRKEIQYEFDTNLLSTGKLVLYLFDFTFKKSANSFMSI